MIYSNFFKEKLDTEGLPNLSVDQFKRYVTIIEIEKCMLELSLLENNNEYNIDELSQELSKLTHNYKPLDLYTELIHN